MDCCNCNCCYNIKDVLKELKTKVANNDIDLEKMKDKEYSSNVLKEVCNELKETK